MPRARSTRRAPSPSRGRRSAPSGRRRRRPAGEVVDLRGCVLLPGLVNTHTHTPMWVFRGLTEDVPRGEWLTGRLLPLERRLGPDELRRRRAGRLSRADRERRDDHCRSLRPHGRGGDGGGGERTPRGGGPLALRSLGRGRSARDPRRSSSASVPIPRARACGPGSAPHATDSCGPELLRRVRRLADRTGARVFIHLAQSEEEVATVAARERHRVRELSRCARPPARPRSSWRTPPT